MPVRSAVLLACLWLLPVCAHAAATPVPTSGPEPAEAAAPAPRVLLVTSLGEITIELDAVAAPRTVENFLAYARDGHYNGTVFHRVVPGLLVQGGAFTPDLQQKPSRTPVPNEAGNGLSNRRGTVAAARDRGVSDSATTQFFINLADNHHFDRQDGDSPYTAGYAVFGRVLQGLDVLDRIAALPTSARGPFPGWVPDTPVLIERVQVLAPAAPVAPVDVEPTTP
ncbi:peptidylprolyl isomerase [Arenimonas daejeonensis]|uniref:peptidylprolyl isomerase n=1 Tax=Arenimonas daejeonensis TaxID=370777 RepID=UPI0011BF0991|nr:peptidylprolyl isomerase [Arenimonas daejeonensis]